MANEGKDEKFKGEVNAKCDLVETEDKFKTFPGDGPQNIQDTQSPQCESKPKESNSNEMACSARSKMMANTTESINKLFGKDHSKNGKSNCRRKERIPLCITKIRHAVCSFGDDVKEGNREPEQLDGMENMKTVRSLHIQKSKKGGVQMKICELTPLYKTIPMCRIEAGRGYHCLIDPFILKPGSTVCQHVFLVNVRELSHLYRRNCFMPVLVMTSLIRRSPSKAHKSKSQNRATYQSGDIFNVWLAGYIPEAMRCPRVEMTLYSFAFNFELFSLEYLDDLKKSQNSRYVLLRRKGLFVGNKIVNRCTNNGECKFGIRFELQ